MRASSDVAASRASSDVTRGLQPITFIHATLPKQYNGDSPPEKTCADKTAQYNKWIRLSGELRRCQKYIRRSGQYPGGMFKFEKSCGLTEQSVNEV